MIAQLVLIFPNWTYTSYLRIGNLEKYELDEARRKFCPELG
jgi:hypothetical protein